MPNAEVDGGLKPETLARRKRVRAAFQAFTMKHYEKDVTPKQLKQKLLCKNVTVSLYPINFHCWIDCIVQNENTTYVLWFLKALANWLKRVVSVLQVHVDRLIPEQAWHK